jgi:ribonuclease Z
MDFYNFWKKEYDIDIKYKLKGFSRGSLRTGFMLLPCRIFLDAGVPSPIKPSVILITHGHQDHIDSLYNHLLDTNEKVQVIASSNLISNLNNYLNSCRSLNVGYKIKFTNWIPTPIITNLNIVSNNIKYNIESIYLNHEVECFGYGISEIRNKLKEEYKDYTSSEIQQAKKEFQITEEKLYPILFFCGDMDHSSLKNLPFDKYPIFIIECTFFEDDHLKEARQRQHLHIQDLIPYFIKHQNTKFILIHFSCRYTNTQIKEFESKYNYDNVIFWI